MVILADKEHPRKVLMSPALFGLVYHLKKTVHSDGLHLACIVVLRVAGHYASRG